MTDYRYTLSRRWIGHRHRAVWIMLNPSTADDLHDDPTIRKCVGVTSRLGAGGLIVVNLYAARATNPRDLWRLNDPIGPDNDQRISDVLARARARNWPVIAAWGAHAKPDRVQAVQALLDEHGSIPKCLGVTLAGQPRHPLYVPWTTPLQPWPPKQDQESLKPNRTREVEGAPAP